MTAGVELEKLREIQSQLGEGYSETGRTFKGGIEANFAENSESPSVQATQQLTGYRFDSNDKKYVLQARLDGFSFSVLSPYDRWEVFRDEARRTWDMYRSVVEIEAITRIAVRYVNRLDIPFPPEGEKVEQSDYFCTYPEVSKKLPYSAIDSFLMRLLIPQHDFNGVLALTQARIEPTQPETIAIMTCYPSSSHLSVEILR